MKREPPSTTLHSHRAPADKTVDLSSGAFGVSPGFILLMTALAAAAAVAFLYVVARDVARQERMVDLRFRIEKREREIETELRTRKKAS